MTFLSINNENEICNFIKYLIRNLKKILIILVRTFMILNNELYDY